MATREVRKSIELSTDSEKLSRSNEKVCKKLSKWKKEEKEESTGKENIKARGDSKERISWKNN